MQIETISKNIKEKLSPVLKKGSEKFIGKAEEIIQAIKIKYFPEIVVPTEIESEPDLKQEAEEITAEANALCEATLKKITERLGSNEGGWYEDSNTGKKYYIKFYKNTDQARVEFLSNSIYKKIGIRAPHSQLMEVEGRLAIVSEEIPEAQATYQEDQRANTGVRDGFIADAYLANWDVVGLSYDNIVKDENGNFVRIDNGGSLTFRAQGGHKEFSPDAVPELENMLNPAYPAGRVFEGLTIEEMSIQARKLVSAFSVQDIEQLLEESGLSGDIANQIRAGLIGRRKVLMDRFNIPEKRRARLSHVFENLTKSKETLELGVRPKASILCDASHVENQEIDFIDMKQQGVVTACFKLTSQYNKDIQKRMDEWLYEKRVERGEIEYQSLKEGEKQFVVADAWVLREKGITVKISEGRRSGYGSVRTAIGLITIDIPIRDGKDVDLNQVESQVSEILESIFTIPSGLEPPSLEAEKKYKEARYRWHHKKTGDLTTEDEASVESLRRREVFPGYFTMVEEGAHKKYERDFGRFAVVHNVKTADRVVSVLQTGLMSSRERFSRGMFLSGMSTREDFNSGGADSVFTRTVTEEVDDDITNLFGTYGLVFNPRILDRTDWYTYAGDEYGSTELDKMEERKTPESLLEGINSDWDNYCRNEQMFRTGISPDEIVGIAYVEEDESQIEGRLADIMSFIRAEKNFKKNPFDRKTLEDLWEKDSDTIFEFFEKRGLLDFFHSVVLQRLGHKKALLAILKEKGITEFNGKPVAEILIPVKRVKDLVAITHGEAPEEYNEY